MKDENAISEILSGTNKRFGALVVTKYYGKNSRIKQLQRVLEYLEKRRQRRTGSKKAWKLNLGELQAIPKENAYFFTAVNGEKFRIPEPVIDETLPEDKQGLYQIFEYEFRRANLEEGQK